MSSFNSTNLQNLFQSFDRLKSHLENYVEGNSITTSANDLLLELESLTHIGRQFHLSTFEQMIVLLTMALELEPNFHSLCAKAQGDVNKSYATLGFALSVLPEAHGSILSPQSPLHYWKLIHTEPGRLLTQTPIKIDRRILCYLLGEPALTSQLADLVTPLSPQRIVDDLSPSYQVATRQIINAWSVSSSDRELSLIYLTGADATINRQIALSACDRLGFQLMALPTAVLPTNPQDLTQLQRYWEREAILTNSVLLLEGDGNSPTDPGRDVAIALFLETLSTPVILISGDRKPALRRPLITVEVPPLSHREQTALWRTYLKSTAAELNGEVDVLASQFRLNPSAIQTICLQAASQRGDGEDGKGGDGEDGEDRGGGGDGGEKTYTAADNASFHDHLWTLCRLQARPTLDDLAQRIDAKASWDDLVLPDRQRQVLSDIATHLKYRARVYQDWGFAQKGDRGLGISALFYGDSGTGKTMAAEVLAQECRLDLYRIDLSTVVSKYIGETEKNLRRIFDAAETGGVILLFDEADALFGTRTDVKDSHDRHANIEVSYLLQRMEAYQGLAILTSNLKNNLDQAFLRRLRFMVPFPFPDAEARTDIWRCIFPTQTPTQGLDYAKLGQLKVTGGNIRNIALNAAFLAAQDNESITMNHIRQAAQRDYLKLEKLLTTEELKGWDYSN